MITIDLDGETARLGLPGRWKDVATHLRTTPQTLNQSRSVLELMDVPITPEVIELLRQITEFCGKRAKGGGGKCTRQEFVRLRLAGRLNERLKALNIIGETE